MKPDEIDSSNKFLDLLLEVTKGKSRKIILHLVKLDAALKHKSILWTKSIFYWQGFYFLFGNIFIFPEKAVKIISVGYASLDINPSPSVGNWIWSSEIRSYRK